MDHLAGEGISDQREDDLVSIGLSVAGSDQVDGTKSMSVW